MSPIDIIQSVIILVLLVNMFMEANRLTRLCIVVHDALHRINKKLWNED